MPAAELAPEDRAILTDVTALCARAQRLTNDSIHTNQQLQKQIAHLSHLTIHPPPKEADRTTWRQSLAAGMQHGAQLMATRKAGFDGRRADFEDDDDAEAEGAQGGGEVIYTQFTPVRIGREGGVLQQGFARRASRESGGKGRARPLAMSTARNVGREEKRRDGGATDMWSTNWKDQEEDGRGRARRGGGDGTVLRPATAAAVEESSSDDEYPKDGDDINDFRENNSLPPRRLHPSHQYSQHHSFEPYHPLSSSASASAYDSMPTCVYPAAPITANEERHLCELYGMRSVYPDVMRLG
ncbi:hypothetical protein LTR37_008965 [Vermiconidia calcicola]|uniref:Uncharacterized protein n=1 Tax=Vermiconidia calcicola TaxID=1690605 RepID=A0ACC3N9A6_9PEZI|nr:hypothetical protein LTR37_008965 [Vermiconidia calcicola]